jgi:hypothetical protein
MTFDFVVKLPKTSRGNDSICVFVDKLTKLVHSVACKEKVSAKDLLNFMSTMSFVFVGSSQIVMQNSRVRFGKR